MGQRTVNEVNAYQIGGHQGVTLTLTGSIQNLPDKCIGVYPNESGCTVTELYRIPRGGVQEATNFAVSMGMSTRDYSSVKPVPKFVATSMLKSPSDYYWKQIVGTGVIECIIE